MTKLLLKSLLNIQFVRFAIVGVCNTLVDVVLFTALRFGGLAVTPANIISTSVALALSLLLNYKYTFKGEKLTSLTITVYAATTLFGLWVLQPLIINIVTHINSEYHFIEHLTRWLGHTELMIILLPKLLSIVVTLIWNYAWYSRVIFKKPQD